jgi:hypothetical protein
MKEMDSHIPTSIGPRRMRADIYISSKGNLSSLPRIGILQLEGCCWPNTGLALAWPMSGRENSLGPQKFELLVHPASQTPRENAGTRLRLFSRGALGK